MTVVFIPLSARPAAASRPSRPPPITTALPPCLAAGEHGVDVVEIAEGDDAGKLGAGNRKQNRPRAGRDEKVIVGLDDAGLRAHASRGAIDGDDGFALAQIDVVPRVPGVVVNDDVVELLVAREHGRQHDAVVVDARLGAEDGHVIAVGRAREELVQHAAGGHSVAEDDKLLSARSRYLCSCVFLHSNRRRSETGNSHAVRHGITTSSRKRPSRGKVAPNFELFLSLGRHWPRQPGGRQSSLTGRIASN